MGKTQVCGQLRKGEEEEKKRKEKEKRARARKRERKKKKNLLLANLGRVQLPLTTTVKGLNLVAVIFFFALSERKLKHLVHGYLFQLQRQPDKTNS